MRFIHAIWDDDARCFIGSVHIHEWNGVNILLLLSKLRCKDTVDKTV
jgi:hypothetical protein